MALGIGAWIIGIPLTLVIRNRPEDYGLLPDGEIKPDTGEEEVVEEPEPDITFLQALKNRSFLFIVSAEWIRMMTVGTVITHIMPYLNSIGISRAMGGFLSAGIPICSIIGRFGFGWIGDYRDKRYMIAIGLGMISIGLFLFINIKASTMIMFIVVFAGIFTWTASVIGVIDKAADLIVGISPNKVVMIILVDSLLLALGMILDAISISYLLMPILIPVLESFGIDPVWYGVIFISALAVGQATPPVGVNLFTAANLIGKDVDSVAKEAIPYVVMDVIVLAVLSLLPVLSLYLPVKAGLYTP